MLNELLHKYLYKQPSKDDARSIKRWIDTASEPEIEQALLQEWEKHTVSEPRLLCRNRAIEINFQ